MHARSFTSTVALLASLARPAASQTPIPFDSPRWQHLDAEVVEHLGRLALQGTASLSDADFRNGVIEFDIAVDGRRSYPGVIFRVRQADTYEHVYVRPHRAGLYPDAVQYAPTIHGIAGWQLYNGDGFTAGTPQPLARDSWIPVRLEVHEGQARVFIGDVETPSLVIPHLQLEPVTGTIVLSGPKDGSAWFSNFRYRENATLAFPPAPPIERVPGALLDWWISDVYPDERVPKDRYPHFYSIFGANWTPLQAAPSGLADISRITGRVNAAGDVVLARTFLVADDAKDATLTLGYSDDVELFLNGRHLFSGRSGYQYRDPSFLGILGPFDDVHVRLARGLNEVFLMVTERFGGWGFGVRADPAVAPLRAAHDQVTQVWETKADFLTSESVLHDPRRDVLYVSSFDNQYAQRTEPSGYISRVSLTGEILEKEWVTGLDAPAGMTIRNDTLWVAERQHLAAIDIGTGRIVARWEIPDTEFPNDVVADGDGSIYISDTRTSDWADSRIYRFRDGTFDIFANEGISRANGLWIHDGWLLVGSSGDGFLKRIRLTDGRIEPVVALGAGIIDGIRVDANGDYLVSCWEGQVYRITPTGGIIQILDALPLGRNTADFEYLPDRRMLYVPTFLGNSVVAYSVRRPS